MQGTGIGPALRKARVLRGKSLEEASRETRIRAEYLSALEQERFDTLLGDVYVRGFLRSYSSYLGLNSDRVVTVYNRYFGPPRSTLPDPVPGPARVAKSKEPQIPGGRRHHPSWSFLVGFALLAMAVFGAAGLLSERSAPAAQDVAPVDASLAQPAETVTLTLEARARVDAVIRTDGSVALDRTLRKGEVRSFEAARRIDIELGRGTAADLTVNGHSLGAPGRRGAEFTASFEPPDFRETASAPSP